ncbi:C-type lectin domain family 4 member E isoform X2 [Amia ocellicauda]|uniref:C-type lectin domain family 4 member E isoform X2 n=1 Tax=Amia ocellicauda TaxID=2972642 RepID=UPI00346435FC
MDVLYTQVNFSNEKGKEHKPCDTAENEVTYSEVQTAGQNSSQSPIVPDNIPPKTAEGQAASRPYLTISLAVLCCLLAAIIIALAVLLHRSHIDNKSAVASCNASLNEEKQNVKTCPEKLQHANKSADEWRKHSLSCNASLNEEKQNVKTCTEKLQHGMTGYFCRKPWMPFHNRCYFFSTDEMNWTSSRDNCLSMQGHLVIIETAEEQTFIKHNVSRPIWIGLTDLKKTGDWRWVDDTAIGKLRYWSEKQPDNYKKPNTPEVEHCAEMRGRDDSYKWNDALCSNNKGRVCEKEAEKLETLIH